MVKLIVTKQDLVREANVMPGVYDFGCDPADVLMCVLQNYWWDAGLISLDKVVNLGEIVSQLISRAEVKFDEAGICEWIASMDFEQIEFSVIAEGAYSLS